jgi:acetyl-CoA C-acetyltransferase
MVAGGEVDIVMAVGVEKMNESPTPTVVEFIGGAGSYLYAPIRRRRGGPL